jgi:hypothetical protein
MSSLSLSAFSTNAFSASAFSFEAVVAFDADAFSTDAFSVSAFSFDGVSPQPQPETPTTDTHDSFTQYVRSKPRKKKFWRLWEELSALWDKLSDEAVMPIPMDKPQIADYVAPVPAPVVSAAATVERPPEIDWAALQRDTTRLYLLLEQNRRRLQDQEDEEEAEMLLMM